MAKAKASPFLVESLPLAASLLAAGLKISNIDRSNPRRAIFTFEETRASELAQKYILGKLPLDAKTLFNRFDDLRTLVRQGGVHE